MILIYAKPYTFMYLIFLQILGVFVFENSGFKPALMTQIIFFAFPIIPCAQFSAFFTNVRRRWHAQYRNCLYHTRESKIMRYTSFSAPFNDYTSGWPKKKTFFIIYIGTIRLIHRTPQIQGHPVFNN